MRGEGVAVGLQAVLEREGQMTPAGWSRHGRDMLASAPLNKPEGALWAPFPWLGGKRLVGALVWERFGDVARYVEPFGGSLAVLLARPEEHLKSHTETVNDADGLLTNFWRAVKYAPLEVAEYARDPLSEVDLAARHRYLVSVRAELTARLVADPEHYDARSAGWWVWGQCAWIAAGWCSASSPDEVLDKMPELVVKRGVLSDTLREDVGGYLSRLAERLKWVRILSGDWKRLVSDRYYPYGVTGFFLDPPYSPVLRRKNLYAVDAPVAGEVSAWCRENGSRENYRIALCGMEGEHDDLEELGWKVEAWRRPGGYGGGKGNQAESNAAKERIWFSPPCLPGATGLTGGLFEVGDGALEARGSAGYGNGVGW